MRSRYASLRRLLARTRRPQAARTGRIAGALMAAAVVMSALGQPPSAQAWVSGIVTSWNVPYTPWIPCSSSGSVRCRLEMDIVRPAARGPWPVFLLLRGGPSAVNADDYMIPLADALAHRGAVVMVADWRQARATGGGYPNSFRDIACAIGVTRAIAARYGGSGYVTLVGHSLGGWGAAVVALSPTAFTPPAGTCNRVTGSLRPNALVTIDGAMDEPRYAEDGWAYVRAFFGGTRAQRPAAYAAGDPFTILARYHANGRRLPTLVVHGRSDTTVRPYVSSWFHRALISAGYPNKLLWIDGTHSTAIHSATVANEIIALVH